MAKTTKPASVDPKELKNSLQMWGAFTAMTKYSIIGIALLLLAMLALLY
jgi:hypothetical protein